ncbi:SAM-dependent methyltransferase [Streptomyces sp. LP11]|uniref:S-adenosyl-L-methionine-dependent methyltransferase n=1 Tax=Streptomyces pyxinicus TaxID=2970331 RepID=A0ABT2BBB6_9ACTN|nr:SAM-dependent methyltransferase [Streptomyces sp. LP11]MCS0605814.1 SAM-dependent methyltransferase [Streptomyces sp. LP11]
MRTPTGVSAQGVAAGVGRTALLVAAARAIETHRPDALARDPFAEHFVRAAPVSADWPVHPDQVPGGDADPLWGRLGRYFALRTRALDDRLLRAARAGVRQVVLLGAGLDSRAYRLDWPPGCTVHEIDTEEVLTFKQAVLDRADAVPAAERRTLAADLRHDWAEALLDTGFDPAEPTAWLAEGLLLYLPASAERRLIATVDRLSASGSGLAYEIKEVSESPRVRANPVYVAARQRLGIDLLSLFDTRPRPDSAGELADRGWTVRVRTPFDFTALHGRGPRPEPDDALAANRWVFATVPAAGRGGWAPVARSAP